MDTKIYPVILAGGSGTRLWPRSREKYPKQFIKLLGGMSLFQETCKRFPEGGNFSFLTVITNAEYRFLVRDQLREMGITNAYIITEPVQKNTAAACLVGARFLYELAGNVPVLFTPADQFISGVEELMTAVKKILPFVVKGSLVLFGIAPRSPHTGYGYVVSTKSLQKDILTESFFVEKPTAEKAQDLLKEGALWNSGIYFCLTKTLLNEADKYIPASGRVLSAFTSTRANEHGFLEVPQILYRELESISIDKAITERTDKIVVVRTKIEWRDLGSWTSLYEHHEKDADGNVIRGDVIALNMNDSYIESTSRLVSVFGLRDVSVIETPDAVLVFPLKEGELIKKLVGRLATSKREELVTHSQVHRPWGQYEILGKSDKFQSKKITVLPGAELSLQRHKRRAEHWIVVSGTATVTKDEDVFLLHQNESTYISPGTIHRLQNKTGEVLELIEVQTGSYFGEDDIERLNDKYGRV